MAGKFIIVPEDVQMKDYQINAIKEWRRLNYQGYFDMATGTGKTYTALAGLSQFAQDNNGRVAAFIVCPYKHLVGQWEEDIIRWGGKPIICHSESEEHDWYSKLKVAFKRFRQIGYPFICLTTNRSFAGDKIQEIIKEIDEGMKVVFVVDEAHNFGAYQLARKLPINISYRLGLSATFERFNDEVGNAILNDYFGEACIHYSLEKAIAEGKSLCPYEYHPILTFLSDTELQKYERITKRILECIVEENGEKHLTEAGQLLVFKRSRLLSSAEDKICILKELVRPYRKEKFMLIYCGASIKYDMDGTETKLIEEITDMLNNEIGISTHKFTSEEKMPERVKIKEMFSDGVYQALTAIKCLDEGVNIPNIRTAFIMASSRNPREFVQRRGRLLRKSEGKNKAIIYDLVILPRRLDKIKTSDFETDRTIVLGEMARVYEFGRLSLNPIETDRMIEDVQNVYNVRFDLKDLMQYCEEEMYELY